MKGRIALVLAISVVVVVLAASLVYAFSDRTTAEEVTYTIADPTGDWGYPSPYTHYSRGPGYIRMSFIFDTLVWKDESGFIPALAQGWEYVEAENAYIFNLQRNATWHDGEKFTAEDVAFTFDYTKEHPYQWVNSSIVGSAEVIDEHTVKLILAQHYAPFLNDVVGTQPILPKHIWEGVTEPDKFTDPEAVVGTGPFKLVDYNKEHGTYLYEAYDRYYQGRPQVDKLIFAKVSEEMTPASLQAGSINAASVPPEIIGEMNASGFTTVRSPYAWNAKLMINHTETPLSDKYFRKALAYAIDREKLVDITQRGYAMAGSPGMIPPDSEWYSPDTIKYGHDPDKAKQLLLDLGYTLQDGNFTKDGQPLELELITQASFKDVGQFVKQQLENIGIKINFLTLEVHSVDARVLNWDFDLSIYGHGGLYEPSILNKVITGSGFNSARYTGNDSLNLLLENQLKEMDPAQRKIMVQTIQMFYAEAVPALTLYYPDWYWAHDGSVQLYYTEGGVASGVPIALNKMAFMQYSSQ